LRELGSLVFLIILVIAAMIDRPVCRSICPFSLLFAHAAQSGRNRLERTDAGIRCRGCRVL